MADGIQIHLYESFVRGDSIFGRPRGTEYRLGVPLLVKYTAQWSPTYKT
jgi:hypothetical protein